MALIEKKERIPQGKALLMQGTAILFDLTGGLINLIPVAGQIMSTIINFLGYMVFGLWFACSGISPLNMKNGKRFAGTALIEMIPILNILPGISFMVFRTIIVVRKEDREYNEKNQEALRQQEGQQRARAQMAYQQRAIQQQEVNMIDDSEEMAA